MHADLCNIDETEEFSHLGIEQYLNKGTVMCVEWGDRIGPLFETIKANSKVIMVSIHYKTESERTISVKEL